MIRAIIVAMSISALATAAEAKAPKKRPDANGNVTRKCEPPKRWVEIDALAADAGRPSPRICK